MKTIAAQKANEKRRIGTYATALTELSTGLLKTSIVSKNLSYYCSSFKHWNTIRKEHFNIVRLIHRFDSYKSRQSGIAYFAKWILKQVKPKQTEINSKKKTIVFFGDGTFRPGGTGYATVPKKTFLKELGIRCITIITPEYRTSKLCPVCFKELIDINLKQTTKQGDRLRQCQTDCVAPSDFTLNIASKTRDRDACGSVAICQKGIYTLIGDPITAYERETCK